MYNRYESSSWKRPGRRLLSFALVWLLFAASSLQAEIQITLKNDFIEQYKDRTSITTDFVIDAAHKRPNPPSKDGDLHVAGRADAVGLPIVAEIMNARGEKKVVDYVHDLEGTGESVTVSGAWRLWCEHGGSSVQIQGEHLDPFTTTNPDHVFEIHPVTTVGRWDVTRTFTPILGFKTKDANQAFTSYENTRCEIVSTAVATTLTTVMGGYNYVEFVMELLDSVPHFVDDGAFAYASVRNLQGELIVRKRRMVFVTDTPPMVALKHATQGDQLHVLGMPRIDLALVSWRREHGGDRPEVLTWNLPYEIIVVGVYKQ